MLERAGERLCDLHGPERRPAPKPALAPPPPIIGRGAAKARCSARINSVRVAATPTRPIFAASVERSIVPKAFEEMAPKAFAAAHAKVTDSAGSFTIATRSRRITVTRISAW